jgi:hypothetical protein
MTTLEKIQAAAQAGQLIASTAENLQTWLKAGLPDWALASIDELVAQQAWAELNDRFYRYLEFGTGGMRGRTIGVVSAKAETGQLGPQGTPEHAAVGCNVLNDFTLIRATIGLYRYTHSYLAKAGRAELPKLVIAHDVRPRPGRNSAARRTFLLGRVRLRSSVFRCAISKRTPASSLPRATIRRTTTDSRPTSKMVARSCRRMTMRSWPR